MKNQLIWLAAFALAMTSLLTTGCSDDDPTTNKVAPSISLVSDVDIVSTDTTVAPGSTFIVRVSASAGDDLITSFTMTEDFVDLTTDRFTNLTDATILNNPLAIVSGSYQTGFNWDIEITAADLSGLYTYEFNVGDEGGLSGSVQIDVTVANNPPTVDFADTHVYTDTTVAADAVFEISVVASTGDNVLENVTVRENGVEVDISRLTVGGVAPTNHPIPVSIDDQDGFTWLIGITAHSSDVATYTVEVTDAAQESGSNAITVLAGDVVELSGKLLYNSSGPTGTGGINLLTGEGTGSADASAHIKDEGVDFGLPLGNNWIQKISGVNGSTIRTLSNSTEMFSFDAIQTKEAILALYNEGDAIVDGVSEVVEIGDIFIVNNESNYFLLEVIDVYVETSTDPMIANDDYYEFAIKY